GKYFATHSAIEALGSVFACAVGPLELVAAADGGGVGLAVASLGEVVAGALGIGALSRGAVSARGISPLSCPPLVPRRSQVETRATATSAATAKSATDLRPAADGVARGSAFTSG